MLSQVFQLCIVVVLATISLTSDAEPATRSALDKTVNTTSPINSKSQTYIFNGKRVRFKKEGDGIGTKIWRVVFVFTFLVAIAFVVLILYKKYYGLDALEGTADPFIKVVDSKRINAKANVIVLEVDGTQYLLIQSGDRIIKLSEKSLTNLK